MIPFSGNDQRATALCKFGAQWLDEPTVLPASSRAACVLSASRRRGETSGKSNGYAILGVLFVEQFTDADLTFAFIDFDHQSARAAGRFRLERVA